MRQLAIVVVAASALGCYAYGGRPLDLGPNALITEAREACRRRDPEAARMLLTRLVREYPASSHAETAREAIGSEALCRVVSAGD